MSHRAFVLPGGRLGFIGGAGRLLALVLCVDPPFFLFAWDFFLVDFLFRVISYSLVRVGGEETHSNDKQYISRVTGNANPPVLPGGKLG